MTEENLQNIITEAFETRNAQVIETLERLEENDSQAASVMRELLDELDQMRANGPFLNPDYVEILSGAAHSLERQQLGSYAEILLGAASLLENQHVDRNADKLTNAVDGLAFLPEIVDKLSVLVSRLEDLQGRDW